MNNVKMVGRSSVVVKIMVKSNRNDVHVEYPLVYTFTDDNFIKSFSIEHLLLWEKTRQHIALLKVKKYWKSMNKDDKLVSIEVIG